METRVNFEVVRKQWQEEKVPVFLYHKDTDTFERIDANKIIGIYDISHKYSGSIGVLINEEIGVLRAYMASPAYTAGGLMLFIEDSLPTPNIDVGCRELCR